MKEETHIERLKRMQEEGKIDVEFELERILGEELIQEIMRLRKIVDRFC